MELNQCQKVRLKDLKEFFHFSISYALTNKLITSKMCLVIKISNLIYNDSGIIFGIHYI